MWKLIHVAYLHSTKTLNPKPYKYLSSKPIFTLCEGCTSFKSRVHWPFLLCTRHSCPMQLAIALVQKRFKTHVRIELLSCQWGLGFSAGQHAPQASIVPAIAALLSPMLSTPPPNALVPAPPCPHSLQNLTTIGSTSLSLSLSSSSSAAALCLWHPKPPLLCCRHAEFSVHIRKSSAWKWLRGWSGMRLLPQFGARIQSLQAKQMQTNASKTTRPESNLCEKTDKSKWIQNMKEIQFLQAKTDANTKQESNLCKQTDATRIVQVMFPSSDVVPSSTKPNCEGRLSWGRNT